MRKGLSPLVATVLLVAFTMAVAIVLSNWVLDYSRTQTNILDERGSMQIGCSGAWLDPESPIYNTTHTRFSVEIINKGNVPLGEMKMIVIYNNGTSGEYRVEPANISLIPGGSRHVYNSTVDSSDITRIRIPHNCSGSNAAATATIEYKDIRFL